MTLTLQSSPKSSAFFCRAAGLIAALAITAVGWAGIPAASAHDYQKGALKIEHPWSRETPSGAKVAGGYMRITNTGKEADRLIGGSLVDAKVFEVHEMRMDGDVMRMRRLDKGLEIPPGQTVELKPGSFHVMFIDLKNGLKQGDSVKGTLMFEKAGTVEVEFRIDARGVTAPTKGNHH